MLSRSLVSGLLAATAMAFPAAEDLTDHEGELVLFKRDDVLDARDLELAEQHGVNMTEMYKHSMIKRDDGDHVVIWVARSFTEYEEDVDAGGQGISKRQKARPGRESKFFTTPIRDWCRDHKRQNHTGPNGPYSGGVEAMYRWARDHSGGAWPLRKSWENLVIAGSNSGANAVYKARIVGGPWSETRVGTKDVRNDADWTRGRARSFSGGWRASSKGGETCDISARINYEIVKTSLKY